MKINQAYDSIIQRQVELEKVISEAQAELDYLPIAARLLDKARAVRGKWSGTTLTKLIAAEKRRLAKLEKQRIRLEARGKIETAEYYECVRMVSALALFVELYNKVDWQQKAVSK